jgi:hypothetical protein
MKRVITLRFCMKKTETGKGDWTHDRVERSSLLVKKRREIYSIN